MPSATIAPPSSAGRASRTGPGRRSAPAGGSAQLRPRGGEHVEPVVDDRALGRLDQPQDRAAPACSCRSRTRRRARASRPARTSRSTPSTADSQLVGRPEQVARRPGSASPAPARESSGSAVAERSGVVAAELMVAWRFGSRGGCSARSGRCGSGSAARSGRPGGSAGQSGTRPTITGRRWRRGRSGRACCAAAPACRGAAGRRRSVRTVPVSTISPAYMTATRSAISCDDAEVVRDQHHAHPELVAERGDAGRGSGPGS